MLLHPEQDPAAVWRYAERYLGAGTRTYSRYADDLDIDPRFHPQRGVPSFPLPTFWIDPDRGSYLSAGTASTLHRYYRHGESFLLPVHPQLLTLAEVRQRLAGCRAGPPIEVAPSANARTMFVLAIDGQPVPPHFVKLHYPLRLSRFTRRLRRPVIMLQLWVSDELMRIGAPVLPEVGGGVVHDGADPDQGWGFLLRHAQPDGAGVEHITVPWLALYGRDVHHRDHPTLLEQLVEVSGQPPRQWLVERLITPVVRLWVQVLLATGCAIEPHGQNTLLRLGPDLTTTDIAYRDCAVYVDPQLRGAAGLTGLPPRNVIGKDVSAPAGQVFSLVYDSFLGHHTLTYLARLAQQRWGLDPALLHRAAAAVFAEQMDLGGVTGDKLLPPTVHYYTDQLPVDGRWQLTDTGQPPQWR